MRKTLASMLLLTLILTSSLNVAFIVRPISAQNNENQIQEKEFLKKTSETTLSSEEKSLQGEQYNVFEVKPDAKQNKTLENSRQPSQTIEDEWNFNDTSGWSEFAYVDGNQTRLIVGVNGDPTCIIELQRIAAEHGAKIVNKVSIGGEVRAVVVELALASVATFSEKTHLLDLVAYIEPNMKFKATFTPNDPYWSYQWGPQKIEADWAWNTTIGNRSITAAVIDTGIDYTHPDIAANYVPVGYDWVNNDTDPWDDDGHGTHCAGIIAAVLNNSIGIAGLAQVSVMAEKGLDYGGWGTEDWLASAIVHAADMGASIISMSWGGYFHSELIYEAVIYAYDAGVLLVAAAGNEATSTKFYPAAYKEVIAVAATDQNDHTAYWSNFGDWIELAAPGVSIYSTVPWGYESWSGTSMACPHVAGVAALVWSLYPNKTRDWVRLWLRYTADDLGDPSFDIYYGYGRINARKAVEWTPPEHELIAYEWETPPYVEPEASATINATILNFGESDEADVTVWLFANGITVDSASIALLASGNSTTISLLWNLTVEGLYNVTLYVVPVPGEVNVENNVLSKPIYVGFPVKAVVLHSAGNVFGDIITNWQVLNNQWYLFGDTMVCIDYTTLNKEDIAYEDIAATEADVLIISSASSPYSGWEFIDSEIEAIERYVHEGHGLIVTAGTLYYQVPNNNKLATLFGLNETTTWDATWTDLLHLLNTTHPLFRNVPNPFVFTDVGTAIPFDWLWDQNELVGGEYVALGQRQESAIVTYRGLIYISPWLEVIPPYYHHHLQLLYNAITWSCYQKPEHELTVHLEAPNRLKPGESTLLNATISNMGRNNETCVELQLLINGTLIYSVEIPELPVETSHTISYPWTPTVEGVYNVTAYAPPVSGEVFIRDNIATKMVKVLWIIVKNVLIYTDDYAVSPSSRYPIVALKGIGINYTHIFDDPWKFGEALTRQPWDMVIVDHCNYYALGRYWTELEGYVLNGGLLIVATFDIDGSDSEPTTLWETMGARWISDMWSPEPVYQWMPSHPVFTYPNTVGNLTSYIEGYWDDGDHVAATTGTPIAGFTSSFTENYTAIVVGNEYKTLLFGFILDEFRFDQDGDGKLDAIELWENAIVYLARAPEHELAITLDVPKFLKPNESAQLNATVHNRGRSNETDVELQLWIDDVKVANITIPELLTESSHTLSYSWSPTVEGMYNITAFVKPVPSEDNIRNNVKSARVIVSALIIALCKNVDPWDYPSNEEALDIYGIPYVVLHSSDFGNVDLSVYRKVVIASDQDQYFYAAMENYRWWFEEYALSGGILEIHAADWGWHGGHWVGLLPGDLAWASYYGQYVTIVDPSHPVLWMPNIISDDELDEWNYAVHGYFSSYPASSHIVIVEDSTRQPAYLEFEYGAGSIVASSQILEWAYKRQYSRVLENSLLYIPKKYEHDIAVQVEAPAFLEVDDSTLLTATVGNRGLNNETDVELYLLINGTVISNITIPELPVNESFTINHMWTPNQKGAYNITAYAPPLSGEEYILNNVATKMVGVFFYRRVYLPHEWIGVGEPMGWHADDASWNYTLPFGFPFYGISYRAIYISSNGLITFHRPDSQYWNSIPELTKKFAIAPAWDDWVTYEPYDIYIWQNSSHVIIRWYVAACYNRDIVANFEAILREDGIIRFNYGYNNRSISATVGISNGSGHILAEDLTNLNYVDTIIFDIYRHDVAIQDVSTYPTQVYAGQTVNINVTAVNEGDVPESFNVTLYYNPLMNASIPTEPHPGNSMWIEPSTINLSTDTHTTGYRFKVTVWVNVTGYEGTIGGWQFKLIYDTAYLNATGCGYTAGDKSQFFENITTFLVDPTFGSYNGTGAGDAWDYVQHGESWFMGDVRGPGYGSLSWVEFEMMAEPDPGQEITSLLDISTAYHPPSSDTYVLDWETLEEIPLNVYNCNYRFTSAEAPPPPPPSGIIGTQTVVNLPANASIRLTFTWNTTDTPLGNYTVRAYAEPVLGETDIEDNTYTDGVVEILWVHDVSIVDVHPSRMWVYQGYNVQVNVTVRNSGNFTENVAIISYYDVTANKIIDTQDIANLLPNESRTITLTWNTADVMPCRNYTITAVTTITEYDSHPEDNIMESPVKVKVRILGDANGDETVNVKDILLVAKAFGSNPDTPRWDPNLDMNYDNKIDIKDIFIVAKNYGKCV